MNKKVYTVQIKIDGKWEDYSCAFAFKKDAVEWWGWLAKDGPQRRIVVTKLDRTTDHVVRVRT